MLKPRLEKFYEKVVCEDFILLYNFKNISQLPAFEQGILHSTSHKFVSNEFDLLQSFSGILLASGKRPIKTKAHKSIAQFAIRKDNILGLKVCLRKKALFTFLDKLLIFVAPKLVSNLQGNMKTLVSLQKIKKQEKLSLLLKAIIFNKKQFLFQGLSEKQEIEESKNAEISYKDITCFFETGELLMFFNMAKGFCFNFSFLLPRHSKNRVSDNCCARNFAFRKVFLSRNQKSVENKLLEKKMENNGNKQLNNFLSLPIKKDGFTTLSEKRKNCFVKNQFISAFQYPENIF